jgi:ABC-2 type transport system ATP-binding protein
MMSNVLEVSGLTKQFGGFTAVNNISFTIKEGEIMGLLGPNGAGKTTTIQMLLALTKSTRGTIKFFGEDIDHHREDILKRINFVSAYSEMQNRVTVRENLQIFSGLYEVSDWRRKADVLASTLGIAEKMDTLYWRLSSGEKARVNLVKAFINDPELILMDEPTASLDPEVVNTVIDLVADMRKRKQVAILYTSHNMGEVSRLCDQVIFLYHGKIIATDTPLGLSRRVGTTTLRLTFDGDIKPVSEYARENKYTHEFVNPHVVEIHLEEKLVPKVLFGLGKIHVWITDIEVEKPDLEDVFLAVAKGGPSALATD